MGARELERETSRKLNLTEETIRYLVDYLQEKAGTKLTMRHFVSAERDSQSANLRAHAYNSLKKNSISVDIRGFKKKQAWCPNKSCGHN